MLLYVTLRTSAVITYIPSLPFTCGRQLTHSRPRRITKEFMFHDFCNFPFESGVEKGRTYGITTLSSEKICRFQSVMKNEKRLW
jgi:hypothetical protein